jgi:hypothetical protein
MVKAFVRQFPLVGAYRAMKPILAVFWNICLLRRGPELVPTHPLFVGAVVIADVLAAFFVSLRFGGAEVTPMQVATSTLVTIATLAAATWTALTLRGVVGRFPATITALFGCDLLFTLLAAIAVSLAGGVGSPVTMGIGALIGIWSIAVNGFILHRAMNVTVFIGIFLAFGMATIGFVLSSAAAGR